MTDKHISEEDLERHHLDRMSDETERHAVEKHLRGCEECAKRAEEAGTVADAFKAALTLRVAWGRALCRN